MSTSATCRRVSLTFNQCITWALILRKVHPRFLPSWRRYLRTSDAQARISCALCLGEHDTLCISIALIVISCHPAWVFVLFRQSVSRSWVHLHVGSSFVLTLAQCLIVLTGQIPCGSDFSWGMCHEYFIVTELHSTAVISV